MQNEQHLYMLWDWACMRLRQLMYGGRKRSTEEKVELVCERKLHRLNLDQHEVSAILHQPDPPNSNLMDGGCEVGKCSTKEKELYFCFEGNTNVVDCSLEKNVLVFQSRYMDRTPRSDVLGVEG